jgi:hypothetical protein
VGLMDGGTTRASRRTLRVLLSMRGGAASSPLVTRLLALDEC